MIEMIVKYNGTPENRGAKTCCVIGGERFEVGDIKEVKVNEKERALIYSNQELGFVEVLSDETELLNRLAKPEKGEPGEKGEKGDPGEKGEKGDTGLLISTETPPADGSVQMWLNPEARPTEMKFNYNIIRDGSKTGLALVPNTLYKWMGETDEIEIVELVVPNNSSIVSEYCLEFYSGDIPTSISFPEVVENRKEFMAMQNSFYHMSIIESHQTGVYRVFWTASPDGGVTVV